MDHQTWSYYLSMLCKLFANKKGFQILFSETLVISVSPAVLFEDHSVRFSLNEYLIYSFEYKLLTRFSIWITFPFSTIKLTQFHPVYETIPRQFYQSIAFGYPTISVVFHFKYWISSLIISIGTPRYSLELQWQFLNFFPLPQKHLSFLPKAISPVMYFTFFNINLSSSIPSVNGK